jgi:tetratricopeptide (TPR) repeat protein
MYIDRRYRGRRRRSFWPIIPLVILLAVGLYLLGTRTRFFENPFNPLMPTPTPTRTALSYLAEAEDYYSEGQLANALRAYEQAAKLEPENDEAFRQQAWLLIQLGHPSRAIAPAQEAVAVKEDAQNLSILAMALDWSGQYDEAIKVALQAVDSDPLSPEAHAMLAEVYMDKNNWARALDEIDTAVKLNPDSAMVQRNLGYVLDNQGRHDEAIDAFERAAALDPKLSYIYTTAGNGYVALGEYENAIAQYEKAVEASPDSPVGYDALGHASALAGDPDRGLSMLKKAIEIDPEYGPAYAHLGRLYYTQLNYESAIENFTKAFDLGVRNEEYFYEQGLAYAYLDDCPNAVKWLEKALEVNPESAPAQQGIQRCSQE